MRYHDICVAAANWDTLARTLHLLCNRSEKNFERLLTWLRRLRTGNVERVEEVLFKGTDGVRGSRICARRAKLLGGCHSANIARCGLPQGRWE